MGVFNKIQKKFKSRPDSFFTNLINDYMIFPIIAVIFGIATIVMVFFIFPFWLFKENTVERK